MDARARGILALALLVPLAGCASGPAGPTTPAPPPHAHCEDQPFVPRTWFLAAGHALANASGAAGEEPGDDAREAFVAEPRPWDSAPLAEGIELNGSFAFDLWVRVDGAPLAAPPTPSMDAFVVQAGSSRALSSGAASAPAPAAAPPGTVVHLNLTLGLPPGGFVIEQGERVRLLVTSLVAGGTTVLVGGGTPSQVRVAARCSEPRDWVEKRTLAFPVLLPASQGSLTHAVPPQEGVNRLTVPFDLEAGTARLSVLLRAPAGRVKGDMDLTLLDADGTALYQAASPFANETMVLWPGNVAALLHEGGHYSVRVDSYSGTNYSGRLTIRLEELAGPHAEDG